MTLLIRHNQLPGSPGGLRFVGADHGGLPISFFLVNASAGSGPELHRHPYPEVFIVGGGRADFQLDDAHLTAVAGDIVIAPAGSAHRFTSLGNEPLRLTAIHTASTMETEWLGPTEASVIPVTKGTPC